MKPMTGASGLGEEIAPSVLDGIDLLVHSVYDMRVVAWREILHINVDGSTKLLRAASDARVPRAIVLSSMSAYSGTEQLYGRAKLDMEIARGHGAISVRPGLVVGRKPGGMAGTLARLVALPITPTLRGLGRQFTLDQDDFVSAILLLAETEHPPTEPVGLAHPLSIEFDGLLRGIATMVGVRSPKLIPVPWRLVDFTLRACEFTRSPTTAIRSRCLDFWIPHRRSHRLNIGIRSASNYNRWEGRCEPHQVRQSP